MSFRSRGQSCSTGVGLRRHQHISCDVSVVRLCRYQYFWNREFAVADMPSRICNRCTCERSCRQVTPIDRAIWPRTGASCYIELSHGPTKMRQLVQLSILTCSGVGCGAHSLPSNVRTHGADLRRVIKQEDIAVGAILNDELRTCPKPGLAVVTRTHAANNGNL